MRYFNLGIISLIMRANILQPPRTYRDPRYDDTRRCEAAITEVAQLLPEGESYQYGTMLPLLLSALSTMPKELVEIICEYVSDPDLRVLMDIFKITKRENQIFLDSIKFFEKTAGSAPNPAVINPMERSFPFISLCSMYANAIKMMMSQRPQLSKDGPYRSLLSESLSDWLHQYCEISRHELNNLVICTASEKPITTCMRIAYLILVYCGYIIIEHKDDQLRRYVTAAGKVPTKFIIMLLLIQLIPIINQLLSLRVSPTRHIFGWRFIVAVCCMTFPCA